MPAPLRIPLRKPVASFDDDTGTVVTKDEDGARDTPASTLSRKDLSQHSQSDISHTLAERRDPGSKLESLVSRFEILDAVNSVDTSVPQYFNSSYKARPSTIPRATGSKQILHQDLISHSPIESISRASSELSPRQIRTPVTFGRKSMLPVSTQPIAKLPNVISCGLSDINRDSTCPKLPYDKEMDTDERQTSGPSSSYFTSQSTISSSSQRSGALSFCPDSHSSFETLEAIHNIERNALTSPTNDQVISEKPSVTCTILI
ncbi:hypothetical protein E0Z10_g22 [Xylaria hypoxylon]|uniref:Uncharacterized protein n=1 Tax=Xylaria hypoxylon TaxID=37992 RepID=A0A4Z0ZI55_9PEZI|nr:hypothetical protein E0Z10_g22 [Xylaria hypoxylon]